MAIQIEMTFKQATVRFDVPDPKAAFRGAAAFAEIFNVDACGRCGSVDVYPEHRKVSKNNKTFDYYSFRCRDCRAELDFGQHVDTPTLFQKRTNQHDGDDRENYNGWYQYFSSQGGGERPDQSQDRDYAREPEPQQNVDTAPASDDDIPF